MVARCHKKLMQSGQMSQAEALPIIRSACEKVISNYPDSAAVNAAKKRKSKVCAVGTTTMRSIESSVSTSGELNAFEGWTNKFIFPPYDFSIADALITNLHTPQSTLLMMVSAFADYDFVKKAYAEAIKEKYRFFSYGDAMLII